jgi:hypothetical protein
LRPHEVEGRRPDPDDEEARKRRRTTVILVAVILGLLAAITLNLMERV